MIQSMTGYGKATVALSDKKVNIEVKSLNSKALDLSTRVAPLYREKEMELRNEIARRLERGKVDFTIWIEKNETAAAATPINSELLVSYYKQVKEIHTLTGIPEPEDWFATLMRMPDVLTRVESTELTDDEWTAVYTGIEEALANLEAFRRQEGAALEQKFREKISNISHLLQEIEPYEKERVGKIQLLLLRFSAGHVELQPFCLARIVLCLCFRIELKQRVTGHFSELHGYIDPPEHDITMNMRGKCKFSVIDARFIS